ncbi:tetratricopeptide repeat protein [Loktanella sp. R86503]|uniref:tetratricopeptide repeat protein n=1 Tax=Loktanella sp. R86503 TaxID=3093847 RepID=UPI0036D9CA1F
MKRLISTGTLLAGLFCAGMGIAQEGDAPELQDRQSGAYLAARNAASAGDFAVAADYFGQALTGDPQNPYLLENTAIAFVALGDFASAVPVAQQMRLAGIDSQVSNMVLICDAIVQGDWDRVIADFDEGRSVSPLLDGLVKAWAMQGVGDMTRALAGFDAVIATEGMAGYGLFHKALALASVGDFEGAEAILSDSTLGSANFGPRAAVAHAQILSQLNRNEDASALLTTTFGDTIDPAITALQARLDSAEPVPFDLVTSPREGVAEVAFMIAALLSSEAREDYTLQYARVAQYLAPGNADAAMLTAGLLQNMGRYDLAATAFASVPQDDPSFVNAEIGRIDTLRRSDQIDVAAEVAQSLARARPDLAFVQARLGDVLRDNGDSDGAIKAYSAALDLYPETDPNRWVVYYTRAIVAHDIGDWDQAEADFRAALAINPDQAQVLNYLGYSLVERGEKLDEALEMIERAVADEPESGAIVDSLGWVYFQLGRYDEAIAPLERAAVLEATDPIVNDHLGDAYWAVGREREARFQWLRAQSFDPEEKLAERIRAKLERGLDAVRRDEGLDATRPELTDARP